MSDDKTYVNEIFDKWRSDNKNPHTFRNDPAEVEKAYMDGKGFIHQTTEQKEKKALKKCAGTFGLSMTLMFLVNILGSVVLGEHSYHVLTFDDVINNRTIEYTDMKSLLIYIAVCTLSFLLPIISFRLLTKLPFRAFVNWHIPEKDTTLYCLPFIIITTIIARVINNSTFASVSKLGVTEKYYNCIVSDDIGVILLFTFFEFFVMPILFEIFFRALAMPVFSQFGGTFTIALTCVCASLSVSSLMFFPYTMLIGITVAYFAYKTRSLLVAIAMRITSRMISYILWLSTFSIPTHYQKPFEYVTYAVLLFFCIKYLASHPPEKFSKFNVSNKQTSISFREKIFTILSSGPFILWLACTIVYSILSVKLV